MFSAWTHMTFFKKNMTIWKKKKKMKKFFSFKNMIIRIRQIFKNINGECLGHQRQLFNKNQFFYYKGVTTDKGDDRCMCRRTLYSSLLLMVSLRPLSFFSFFFFCGETPSNFLLFELCHSIHFFPLPPFFFSQIPPFCFV
jgi:hypothetical protein